MTQADYTKNNPYQVWAYRNDGSKCVVKFKNRREALAWSKATNTPLGAETTAGQLRGPKQQSQQPRSMFGQSRMPFRGFRI